ncbi:hypothetical protein N8T08_002446 [Aspergillus melleus]|uniref:Uncharacterized protein n=1 Tax=Aspergillus melleus TaxID=138277 RepID=A0ACC3AM85_9EURO|nr:hypothetical protein N8T08_002446 [Aspergillus melleus]
MSSHKALTMSGPYTDDNPEYHPSLAGAVTTKKLQQTLVAQIAIVNDAIVMASPGQGVTLGCIIGILNAVLANVESQNKPKAVILVSTRELAIECYDFVSKIEQHTGLSAQSLIGESAYEDANLPSSNFDIIVGAPEKTLGGAQSRQLLLNTL